MESDDTVQRGGLVAMTLKRGMPCSAPVKCIKKALPTQSQHAGQMTHPRTAGSSAFFSNIPASVHVTFLFSHYLSSWGKTHNMSSEQQHHAMIWCMDLKMPGNIYQKIAHHYEVLLGPRVESGKLLESALKNWCFSYSVIKFIILSWTQSHFYSDCQHLYFSTFSLFDVHKVILLEQWTVLSTSAKVNKPSLWIKDGVQDLFQETHPESPI